MIQITYSLLQMLHGNVYFTKTNEEHEAKRNELKANNLWLF